MLFAYRTETRKEENMEEYGRNTRKFHKLEEIIDRILDYLFGTECQKCGNKYRIITLSMYHEDF